MAKPTSLAPWATNSFALAISGQQNKVAPPAAWQTDGWDENEEPPCNYENYQKNIGYEWRKHYDERVPRTFAFVCASDASALTTEMATNVTGVYGSANGIWLCDGTADDVQIQAAIDAVNSVGGGVVMLSEGTFTIADGIDLKAFVSVLGQGTGATTIEIVNASGVDFTMMDANAIGQFRLADFSLDGNKANNAGRTHQGIVITTGDQVLVENLRVRNLKNGIGISTVSSDSTVRIRACQALYNESYGVSVQNGSVAEGCYAYQNQEGYFVGHNSHALDCQSEDNTAYGFRVGGDDAVVRGGRSTLDADGLLASGDRYLITGMQIDLAEQNGMELTGDHGRVDSNFIYSCSQAADDTHDGIECTNADWTHITNNTVRSKRAPNDHKYGLEVTAGVDTYAYNNDLYHSAKAAGVGGSYGGAGTWKTIPEWVSAGADSSVANNTQNDMTRCNRV